MELSEKYKSNHNKAKLRNYRRNWKKDHLEKGLCLDCNNKAELGKRRCQKHLDNQANMRRNKKEN